MANQKQAFSALTTTQLGNISEDYLSDFLIKAINPRLNFHYIFKNYPVKNHPFDMIIYSATTNQKFLCDVKVKFPNKYDCMSIHENDIKSYSEWAEKEKCQFLLFYMNPRNGEICSVTPKMIRNHTVIRTFDKKEMKWMIYFSNCWKVVGQIPEDILLKMNELSKELSNK